MCYVCSVQSDNDTWSFAEHLKSGWCDWELNLKIYLILINLNENSRVELVFAAPVILFLRCSLLLHFHPHASLTCQSCPVCQPRCLSLPFVQNQPGCRSLLSSSRAGVWVSLQLSWSPPLPFSRNLKAALPLLSCCGFSQRLQKPVDLSRMSTQRITL